MTRPETAPDYWHGAVPIHVGAVSGTQQIMAGGQSILGFSCRETTGAAAASFDLVDGGDANGQPVAQVNVNASGSVRDWFGPHGVWVSSFLTVHVLSGTVDLVVWVSVG